MEKGNITPLDFKEIIKTNLGIDLGFNFTVNKINDLLYSKIIITHDQFNSVADLHLRSGHHVIEWKEKEDFELFIKSLKSSDVLQ